MADLPKSNKKHRKSIFKRIHANILPQPKSKLKKKNTTETQSFLTATKNHLSLCCLDEQRSELKANGEYLNKVGLN